LKMNGCMRWAASDPATLTLLFYYNYAVLVELEERGVGRFWDIGRVPLRNFDWLPFTPLWSSAPTLQLVSEPVWSLVGFNRLFDLKMTWRKML
jgi:hypothetical protein